MALTDRPRKVGPDAGSNGQASLTPRPRPYNWRATAGLILGIVIVAGAMGVFMRVIPTPFTQPAPTSTSRLSTQPTAAPGTIVPDPGAVASTPGVSVAPTQVSTAVARSQATIAATPTMVGLVIGPLAAPTIATPVEPATNQLGTVGRALQPTSAPAVAPTLALQPIVAATLVPETQPTPAPTSVQEPTAAVVDPALEAEILDAYSRYWQVRDDALATLDGSHLDEVMYGEELLAAQTYLDQLRSQGRAGVGTEDHSITLVSATSEDAVIYDRVIDKGVFVDPQTRETLPPDQQAANPETEVTGYYYLHNIDGLWKVVREG